MCVCEPQSLHLRNGNNQAHADMKVMVCVVGAALVGVNLEFEPLPVQGCPACAPGPSTCVISLRTQQRHCVSRGTRQSGQGHSGRQGHARTCRDLAPPRALLLASQNPGPARLPLYGASQETALPTTSFSGQQEPFGVRGLCCGASTIKIKIARPPQATWTRGPTAPEKGAPNELANNRDGDQQWERPYCTPAPLPDYVGSWPRLPAAILSPQKQAHGTGVTRI